MFSKHLKSKKTAILHLKMIDYSNGTKHVFNSIFYTTLFYCKCRTVGWELKFQALALGIQSFWLQLQSSILLGL